MTCNYCGTPEPPHAIKSGLCFNCTYEKLRILQKTIGDLQCETDDTDDCSCLPCRLKITLIDLAGTFCERRVDNKSLTKEAVQA